MNAKFGVALIAAAVLLYIGLVGQLAVLLLTTGEPIGIAMGVALIVLPVIGVWALGRELWFGVRAQQLAKRLEAEGALPAEEVTLRPSGRPVREEADALFPQYRAAAEAAPEDWRAWFRLALAYDGAGDRRRAREAVRKAIALEKSARA